MVVGDCDSKSDHVHHSNLRITLGTNDLQKQGRSTELSLFVWERNKCFLWFMRRRHF